MFCIFGRIILHLPVIRLLLLPLPLILTPLARPFEGNQVIIGAVVPIIIGGMDAIIEAVVVDSMVVMVALTKANTITQLGNKVHLQQIYPLLVVLALP